MVIIGAGISAIAAANLLINEGINDVVILEATDRVGGRIYSIDLGMFTGGMLLNHGPICCRVYGCVTPVSVDFDQCQPRLLYLCSAYAATACRRMRR